MYDRNISSFPTFILHERVTFYAHWYLLYTCFHQGDITWASWVWFQWKYLFSGECKYLFDVLAVGWYKSRFVHLLYSVSVNGMQAPCQTYMCVCQRVIAVLADKVFHFTVISCTMPYLKLQSITLYHDSYFKTKTFIGRSFLYCSCILRYNSNVKYENNVGHSWLYILYF